MMYRIRQGISAGNMTEVLQSRFPDDTPTIQDLKIRNLTRTPLSLDPPMEEGRIMRGLGTSEYMRDVQMFSFALNTQAEQLEYAVDQMVAEQNGFLADVLATAEYAKDLMAEVQIQVQENYTSVSSNSFGLPEDLAVGPHLEADPKNGWNYKINKNIKPVRGIGLTQPLRSIHEVSVEDVYIDTSLSDREFVLENDSPNNLLLPNTLFHQIVGISEESDSYIHRKNKCELVIGFKLEHVQDVNIMDIKGLSSVAFRVTKLEYKDLDDNWTEIAIEDFAVLSNKRVIFPVVTAKALRVTFEQTASERRLFVFGKEPVNELLENQEFSYRLDEEIIEIQGAIFDFSMREVRFHLASYFPDGFYQAPEVPVMDAYGVSIKDTWTGDGYVEKWLYTYLEDENAVVNDGFIPLPDSNYLQREVLFPEAGVCKVKLFPQQDAALQKFRIKSIDSSFFTMTVETETPHGFSISDTVTFMNAGIDGTFTITATPSTTSFQYVAIANHTFAEGTTPRAFVYDPTAAAVGFTVYEDGVALTVGTDYEYSLDTGSTWKTSFDYATDGLDIQAGRFLVKLYSANVDKRYHIEYYYYPLQKLNAAGSIMLRNRVIELAEGLKGHVRPVYILRSNTANIYNTLNLKQYWVKTKART